MTQTIRFLMRLSSLTAAEFKENIEKTTWLGLLLMSVALVLTAGFKYDAWSCFHGRLFLQSFFSLLITLYTGLSYLQSRKTFLFNVSVCSVIGLSFLYIVYFGVEILYKFIT